MGQHTNGQQGDSNGTIPFRAWTSLLGDATPAANDDADLEAPAPHAA